RSIIDIAKEREVVVKNARVGKIAPENMGGGTFTISNLGSYEVDFFTPIIDIPQVAILGIGKTQDEVVVIDKEICIKPMAYFSLVADHRVVDGAPAVEFLGHLKAIIENPIGYIV
ncbi:MAG: 2-oxo acid dehydrogenase subunit E2, partial [Firmicutes bacterium]|nr:2-oxo acid dehydrogenase subunit E2 [Bacillota bacterium]